MSFFLFDAPKTKMTGGLELLVFALWGFPFILIWAGYQSISAFRSNGPIVPIFLILTVPVLAIVFGFLSFK